MQPTPATGRAHCALPSYWARRLGKSELHGFEASARGAELRRRLMGERVGLEGMHLLSGRHCTMVSTHVDRCHRDGVRFAVTHDPVELTTVFAHHA